MINLKLAEYEDGKFKGFLELGINRINEDNKNCLITFKYCGDFIEILKRWNEIDQEDPENEQIKREVMLSYKKDKADPLNRFGGLFNGRTYGEGSFVLIGSGIKNVKQDDIWLNIYTNKKELITEIWKHPFDTTIDRLFCLGNLHQKPELYENLKQ